MITNYTTRPIRLIADLCLLYLIYPLSLWVRFCKTPTYGLSDFFLPNNFRPLFAFCLGHFLGGDNVCFLAFHIVLSSAVLSYLSYLTWNDSQCLTFSGFMALGRISAPLSLFNLLAHKSSVCISTLLLPTFSMYSNDFHFSISNF